MKPKVESKVYDSEYAKNMRRFALHQIKAIVSNMLEGSVDNPREGYRMDVEKLQNAVETLRLHRAFEEGFDWDWSD
jgi:hypothetical protein